ncbi:hypothetical protein Fmac_000938 [Flemingia macrophylla]|uniref:Exostosin GT47 domain-containing protein n=1 Tax=Flemingia macrophylla TaxID=520843 RepID=A0ABD1NHA1_9FABA
MGRELSSIFQLEKRRLLLLIGITFAMILAFQYFELPSGEVQHVFFDNKTSTSDTIRFQAADLPYETEMFNNMTTWNQENSTGENFLEIANETRTSEENDTVSRTGPISKPGGESNTSLGFDVTDDSSTVESIGISNNGSILEKVGNLALNSYNNTISHSIIPNHLAPPLSPTKVSPNITPPMLSNDYEETDSEVDERLRPSEENDSFINSVLNETKDSQIRVPKATTISEMKELLLQNHASYSSMRPRWSSAVDQELLQTRSEIENAPIVNDVADLYAPLFRNISRFKRNLIQYLKNYVDLIAGKHHFWNRTGGADHFLVACHDWAPTETKKHMAKCLRALCNADVKEGFVLGKDVSLPETYVRNAQRPTRNIGGNRVSKRKTLAFFAGGMHGYVRPILLQHWENKDPDMKIFGTLPSSKGNRNYIQYMKSSKYCICAKGYEVNSPRVVEAIFYECVPVIISDNFVPPFFEVLNWESFAVFVEEKDIPNLKNILLSIPLKRYLEMQIMVKRVQQHFLWHRSPVKFNFLPSMKRTSVNFRERNYKAA